MKSNVPQEEFVHFGRDERELALLLILTPIVMRSDTSLGGKLDTEGDGRRAKRQVKPM